MDVDFSSLEPITSRYGEFGKGCKETHGAYSDSDDVKLERRLIML